VQLHAHEGIDCFLDPSAELGLWDIKEASNVLKIKQDGIEAYEPVARIQEGKQTLLIFIKDGGGDLVKDKSILLTSIVQAHTSDGGQGPLVHKALSFNI